MLRAQIVELVTFLSQYENDVDWRQKDSKVSLRLLDEVHAAQESLCACVIHHQM